MVLSCFPILTDLAQCLSNLSRCDTCALFIFPALTLSFIVNKQNVTGSFLDRKFIHSYSYIQLYIYLKNVSHSQIESNSSYFVSSVTAAKNCSYMGLLWMWRKSLQCCTSRSLSLSVTLSANKHANILLVTRMSAQSSVPLGKIFSSWGEMLVWTKVID